MTTGPLYFSHQTQFFSSAPGIGDDVMLAHELFIAGTQGNDALDQADQSRNASPAEADADDSFCGFTHIEVLNADIAEQNCKDSVGDF